MVKYNYAKYENKVTPDSNSANWQWQFLEQNVPGSVAALYDSTSFSNVTSKFSVSGSVSMSSAVPVGTTGYTLAASGGLYVEKHVKTSPGLTPGMTYYYSRYTAHPINIPVLNTRGNLISNMVAEDGTYPADGRHTDGYWYVRGTVANTAPNLPGAFTQPTGTLEIGDAKVVSWGASSDAESNLAKYVLEASINSGAFTAIAQPTTPTFTYTVPSATSVKFRVKAVDSGGLESGYRDSALLTVSKPAHYWSKHNSDMRYTEPAWESQGNLTSSMASTPKTYTWDSVVGKFIEGTTSWQYNDAMNTGDVGYNLSSGDLYRYTRLSGNGTAGGSASYKLDLKVVNKKVAGYIQGAIVHSGFIDLENAYPINGRHTDGYWYVRGSRVSQSIAPPSAFTTPAPNAVLLPKQALTLAFGASTAPALSTYEVESRYNAGAWTAVGTHSNTLIRPFTVTSDKQLKTVEYRVRAKNTSNVYSDWVYSEAFAIQHNQIPTITLETANNKTLYENDTFIMEGAATDTDINDILNVKYQIGSGEIRPIETAISKGAAIPYRKVLTFKSGFLYDDGKAITDALSAGSPYTLKVWAEDDQGGKSTIEERIFFVVPNRPPALSVDPLENQSGLINPDTITISGASSDPDGNDVVVKYRINEQAAVQIHSGPAGTWSFDVALKLLKDGENTIVVEVTDTHNFKSSKTIKLNKTANLTPLSKSVQRYTIVPPAGTAQGVLLWLERDELQDVALEISMTNGTEQEQFKPMTLDSSGPANIGSVENFFKFRADAPAGKIAIKLSWTGDKPIFKVSGALTQ